MKYYTIDDDWTKRTAWAADTLAGLRDLDVLVEVTEPLYRPCGHAKRLDGRCHVTSKPGWCDGLVRVNDEGGTI